MTLVSHSSAQLVNYQKFAIDCQVSVHTVQSHLQKLEQTYIISKITPFVGNKITEITSNPKYYFVDNGFKNQAIRNFNPLHLRSDAGSLVENFIYQEIVKFKHQNFYNFDIHFWRTKTKAEVDFVLYKNKDYFIPIESKYETFKQPTITRSYRSFLEAYQSKYGIIITKNYLATEKFENTTVHFIPLEKLEMVFPVLEKHLSLTKQHC